MKKISNEKSNRPSIIITSILLVLIAVVFVFSLTFGEETNTPSLFGYNIHVMNGKAMEDYIPNDSAVVSKVGVLPQVKEVGLCRLDDQKTVTILLLAGIEESDEGKVYLFKTTTSEDYEVVKLKESNILGTAQWISLPLGRVIRFATSRLGIILLLIIPAVIILISLLVSIAKGLSGDKNVDTYHDDDEFIEEDEDVKNAVLSFKAVDAVPEISKEAEFVDEQKNETPAKSSDKNSDDDIKKEYSFTEQILMDYSTNSKSKTSKKSDDYIDELLNAKHEEIAETDNLQSAHHVSLDKNGVAEYNKVTPTAQVSDLEKTLPPKHYTAPSKSTADVDDLLSTVGQHYQKPAPKTQGKVEDLDIAPKKKQSATNKAIEEMMRMLEQGKK